MMAKRIDNIPKFEIINHVSSLARRQESAGQRDIYSEVTLGIMLQTMRQSCGGQDVRTLKYSHLYLFICTLLHWQPLCSDGPGSRHW